ncbi:porin [Shewanella sp. Choline-02u-19]|nr:porin [Shewanella sp. Bg11-22]PKI30340.1 porin [Shewanella sp. Choline-02u-19]
MTMMKIMTVLPLSLCALTMSAHAADTLEQKVEKLNERIQQLEGETASPSQFENSKFSLYGSFRPTLVYKDNQDNNWDIGDALSRVGIKASTEFSDGWSAIAQGEWSVDISNNGDLGKARLAYLGIASPYGQVAFGKQRPAQYTLIEEYVDIFNNAASPFAFDSNGPFFVDNFATYKLSLKQFTLMTSAQLNGNNDTYLYNSGLAFDKDSFHVGVTYLDQNTSDSVNGAAINGEQETWAASVAYGFKNGLYLAAAYTDVSYDFDVSSIDKSGSTLDTALAYPIADQYKVKLGYFDYDDGKSDLFSQSYSGYNTTLEWNPVSNIRLHLEYLAKNYDQQNDDQSVTLGFRYDFNMMWGK